MRRFHGRLAAAAAALILTLLACPLAAAEDEPGVRPIAPHPDNPRYFLFRGRPTVLVTSGEHYGAVLNRDFDYVKYLDTLRAHGFNQTRAFSGAYREVPGSFNIRGNTLAPEPRSFVAPWARSPTPGAGDGLNKFDLSAWDPAYFRRLADYVREAGARGVVVELVLFCTMYDDRVWAVSPMNPANNVNRLGNVGRGDVYSGANEKLTAFQEALARKLVTELRGFDNVYFEVCNEPYERGGLTKEWNDRIVAAVVAAEADLPAERRHLIAQGFARGARIQDPNPHVSVFNFHAASPEDAARNHALGKILADDETGGGDRGDRKYRAEGWRFLLAGGAVYSHLDFSFTTDRPDGSAVPLPEGTPGGGGPALRRQIQVLKEFVEGLPFTRMRPDDSVIQKLTLKGPDGGQSPGAAKAGALAERGKAYAVYVNGGPRVELVLDLPAGEYAAEWVSTQTGRVESRTTFEHAGGDKSLTSPAYAEDIALRVLRVE